MHDLIKDYNQSLYKIEKAKEEASDEDKKTLGSMASDLRFAIQWMRTARMPNVRRGVENLSAYQIDERSAVDPIEFQIKYGSIQYDPYTMIDDDDEPAFNNQDLENFLQLLSRQEYDAYVSVKGKGLTYSETAELMECCKSTVQSYVTRAEDKIQKALDGEIQISLVI